VTTLVVTANSLISLPDGDVRPVTDLLAMMEEGEGIIVCYGAYGLFGNLIDSIRDKGWRIMFGEPGKHKTLWLNKPSMIYVRYISIGNRERTGPRRLIEGNRKARASRKKWTVINLQEWGGKDPANILDDTLSLLSLAEARGVKLRSSMGATASAMVRRSSEWPKGRRAATWEMEPVAKRYLPCGHNTLRRDAHSMRKALYIDKKSAHINITADRVIPAQESLRFRGFTRAAEAKGVRRHWFSPEDIATVLRKYVGLYYATVQCELIPESLRHLYPWWALEPGEQDIAIWSPELALLDEYVRLQHISGGLLSPRPDWAMCEYATWALEYAAENKSKITKRVLLAGVGMLGVNTSRSFDNIIIGNNEVPERAQRVKMPLYGDGYRNSIDRQWHPSIQNPIGLGVIQAHCKTDTLLLGRRMEREEVPILQVVTDAVIAGLHRPFRTAADGSPFIPDGWTCDTLENWRTFGTANQVLCDNHPKLPGIPLRRKPQYLAERRVA
jgi:hypothetical protein